MNMKCQTDRKLIVFACKKRWGRAPFNPKKDHKMGNKAPSVCKPQIIYKKKR